MNFQSKEIEMRLVAMVIGGFIGLATVATMVGCNPTYQPQMQTCPTAKPWVPDQYVAGKWVPGHCEGEPAV
jgi:hypothetical protein